MPNERYNFANIERIIKENNPEIEEAVEQNREKLGDPNVSYYGAKNVQEIVKQKWSQSPLQTVQNKNKPVVVHPDYGRRTMSDNPAVRIEQEKKKNELRQRVKDFYDPKNKMDNETIETLTNIVFADAEEENWLVSRMDAKLPTDELSVKLPYSTLGYKIKEAVREANELGYSKTRERVSAERVEAMLAKEKAYLAKKKIAAYNDLGSDKIVEILALNEKQRKLQEGIEAAEQKLQDPNILPEEKLAIKSYLEQKAPLEKENISKKLAQYEDKAEIIAGFEEYDKEAPKLQKLYADYYEKYDELKKRRKAENVVAGSLLTIKALDGVQYESTRAALNLIIGGLKPIINLTEGTNTLFSDLEGGIEKSDPNRGKFGRTMDGINNAVGTAFAMYYVGKIGAGARMARAEQSASAIGKYFTNLIMNPTTYTTFATSYNENYYQVLEEGMRQGMSDAEARSYARGIGAAMGFANAAGEGLFDEVKLFQGITGKQYLKMLSEGKDINYKQFFKEFAKRNASELSEELTTMGMETATKAIANAISTKDIYEDVIPSGQELFDLVVGTVVASEALAAHTRNYSARKNAMLDLAADPTLAMKGLDNLVAIGAKTEEQVKSLKNEVIGLTGVRRQFKNASAEDVLKYYELDNQEKEILQRIEESAGDATLTQINTKALQEIKAQKDETATAIAIKQDLYNKAEARKKEAEKENNKAKTELQNNTIERTPEQIVEESKSAIKEAEGRAKASGVTQEQQKAIDYLNKKVGDVSEDVKNNGLSATTITNLNQESKKLEEENNELQKQYEALETQEGAKQEAQKTLDKINENKKQIEENNSVVKGIKELNVNDKPKEKGKAALVFDENQTDSDTDLDIEVAESKFKESFSSQAKKGNAPKTAKEVTQSKEYNDLVRAYASEGLSPAEAIETIRKTKELENMSQKEMNEIEDDIKNKIPANNSRLAAQKRKEQSQKEKEKSDNRPVAKAIQKVRGKAKSIEQKSTQRTKLVKEENKGGIQDREAVKRAIEHFKDTPPSKGEIDDFVDNLVKSKEVSKRRARAIKSRIKSYYNTNTKSKTAVVIDEDFENEEEGNEDENNRTGENEEQEQVEEQEQKPFSLEGFESEEEQIEAQKEAKSEKAKKEDIGEITEERMVAMKVRAYLSSAFSDFMKMYNDALTEDAINLRKILTEQGAKEIKEKILAKIKENIEKELRLPGKVDELYKRDADGKFTEDVEYLHALNEIADTLFKEGEVHKSNKLTLFETIRETARAFAGKKRSIENEISLAIKAIEKKYNLTEEETEITEEDAKEAEEIAAQIEGGDKILANIIDKNRGDKTTKAAEAIAKIVDVLYKKRLKEQGDKASGGVVYSHAFIASLIRKNGGDVVKTISYIQARLSSTKYPVKDTTTRIMMQSIAEVLYTFQNEMYKNAKNIAKETNTPYNIMFVNNSIKSIFSSHILKYTNVSINRAGLISIYTANQNKIRRELRTEIEKKISNTLSDLITEKPERVEEIRNKINKAKRNPSIENINEVVDDILNIFRKDIRVLDTLRNSFAISIKSGISKREKIETLNFLEDLISNKSDIEKRPMFQALINNYIKRNENEMGAFAETKWRNPSQKVSMTAVHKDNRTVSSIMEAAETAKESEPKDKEKGDTANENNVVLNSDNKIYGTGERKKLLSMNPLLAIRAIAKNLGIRQIATLSIAKGKTVAIDSDKLRKHHIVLVKIGHFLNALKFNTPSYQFVNQITGSPRIYTISGARLISDGDGFKYHETVKGVNKQTKKEDKTDSTNELDLDPIKGTLLNEVNRAISEAKKRNPNITDEQIRYMVPTFFEIKNGKAIYSDKALNEQARKEYKAYIESRIAEYYNPSTAKNAIAAELAKKALIDAAMLYYDKGVEVAVVEYKQAIDKIKKDANLELTSGLKDFAKKLTTDQIFNMNKNTKEMFIEYVVNEEFNRYYLNQFIRGGQEYFMDKDPETVFVRAKTFDSPGIPVMADIPFNYIIMDKNMFNGKETIEVEFTDSNGNKTKKEIKPGDGVMFLSEKANITIAAAIGPQIGYIDQYKYAMSTVNSKGEPTAHKGMQIVLTKDLANNNLSLKKLYELMEAKGLDAILDDSAEKIGVEKRMPTNWNDGTLIGRVKDYVHTANYSDIFIQVPVNGEAKTNDYKQSEQMLREATLLSNGENEQLVDTMIRAAANKVLIGMDRAMKASKEFKSLVKNYKKASQNTKSYHAQKLISFLENRKKGRSEAEKGYLDSVIKRIQSGYSFEYDDGLLYNLQTSIFKQNIQNKMKGMYLSLMTTLASRSAPKYRINEGMSEIVLPERFKKALEAYRDEDGDIYITGIKIPYANAGTQFRAKVRFDSNLDQNGTSAIVPNEFYALSNSDSDGDHIFIYPMDPNLRKYKELLKENMIVDLDKNEDNPIDVIKRIKDQADEDIQDELLEAYEKYQDAIYLKANQALFETSFGEDMQQQVNDVTVFEELVKRKNYTTKSKHTLSSEGQVQRSEEVSQSTDGIGIAASMINVLMTTFKIGDKMRVAFRKIGAQPKLFKIGKTFFDPAVLEAMPVVNDMPKKITELTEEQLNEARPGVSLKTKMNFQNGKTQLLQLYLDTLKKGYMAKIGLNEANMNVFNYLVARLSISTSQERALELAIDFINQPIIKKYFELTERNQLLKDEYLGNNFTTIEQLKKDLIARNKKLETYLNNDVAELDYLQSEYSGTHVKELDYVNSIDLVGSNDNYAIAQAEALKMLESLNQITSIVSSISLNRKKFEEIPTNIEDARTFMTELENIGIIATDKNMQALDKMITKGMSLDEIRSRFAYYKKAGWQAGIKVDAKSGPETALQKIKEINEAISEQLLSEEKEVGINKTINRLTSQGLSVEGAINYLNNLKKIYAQEVITGNKQLLEDELYFAKAQAFFMNMAHVGDTTAAYKEKTFRRFYKTVSSFIRPQSKKTFSNTVSRIQQEFNREVLKEAIDDNLLDDLNPETRRNLTYGLSTILEFIAANKTMFPNNGFIRNLETEIYEQVDAEEKGNEKGHSVYREGYWVLEKSGYREINATEADIPRGSREEFNKTIASNPLRAFAIALQEATKDENDVLLAYDEKNQKLFNAITGQVYEGGKFSAERIVTGADGVMLFRTRNPKEAALHAMATSIFGSMEAPSIEDTYDQWVSTISAYMDSNKMNMVSPRYMKPETTKTLLAKNGKTDFTKEEFEDIRSGIKKLYNHLHENANIEKLEEKLERLGIDNSFLSEEVLSNPAVWLMHFSDQMHYSRSRELVDMLSKEDATKIKAIINDTYENENDIDYNEYTLRAIYNNPTLTPFYNIEHIKDLKAGSEEATNFGHRHEYFHTEQMVEEREPNGDIKEHKEILLFKRIQVGYIQKEGGKNGIKIPNYKYVKVGRYDMRGEVALDVAKQATKIDTIETLIEVVDNLYIGGATKEGIYQELKRMVYGISEEGDLDTTAILKNLQFESNENEWGYMVSMNSKDFIKEMRSRMLKGISMMGPSEQETKDKIISILHGLNAIEKISSEADTDNFIIDSSEFMSQVNETPKSEIRKYRGRMLLRSQSKQQANPKRLPVLDLVRNLMSYTQTGIGSIRSKTIGEYVKLQSKSKGAPTNIRELIGTFQSGFNASPFINQVAQMMANRIGSVKTEILSQEDFTSLARKVFPGRNPKDIQAFYHDNKLYFNAATKSIDAPELILHEALHAFTYHAMNDEDNTDLRETMLHIRNEIKNAVDVHAAGNISNKHQEAYQRLKHLLDDITLTEMEQMEEVISYVFSDKSGKMQAYLSSLKSKSAALEDYRGKGDGMWGTIKNFISKAISKFLTKLGIGETEGSIFEVLTNTMEVYNDLFATDMVSTQGYAKVNQIIDDRNIGIDEDFARVTPNLYNITQENAKDLAKRGAAINDSVHNGMMYLFKSGTVLQAHRIASALAVSLNINSKKFEDNTAKAILSGKERIDNYLSNEGEDIVYDFLDNEIISHAQEMKAGRALVGIDKEGSLSINAYSINYGNENTNESYTEGVEYGDASEISKMAHADQVELLKAATQAYFLSQGGYDIKAIRLFTSDVTSKTTSLKEYSLSDLTPLVKNLITQKLIEDSNSGIYTSPTTMEEYLNGTNDNYSTFYSRKMAERLISPEKLDTDPTFLSYKDKLISSIGAKQAELTIAGYKKSYASIYEFLKNGNLHDLKKEDLTALLGEVRQLQLRMGKGLIGDNILHGIAEILLLEEQGRTLKQNDEIIRESEVKDIWSKSAVVKHSLNTLSPNLGVSEIISDIQNTIDDEHLELRNWQKKFEELAFAVSEEKGRMGAKWINKTLNRYRWFPKFMNKAFDNIYEEKPTTGSNETFLSRRFKSINQAAIEVANGKMSEKEYELLKHIVLHYAKNHEYIYNTKGVNHGGMMDEGKALQDIGLRDRQYYVPYYQAGTSAHIEEMSGARKFFAQMRYSLNKAFPSANPMLHRVTLDEYTLKNGEVLRGQKIEDIMIRMESLARINPAYKVTDQNVTDLFDAARRAKKIKEDSMLSELANESMALPGFIRTKEDYYNPNLFDTMMSFSKETAKAKIFNKSRGMYLAAIAVAETANKTGIANFLKSDMQTRVLEKKYNQKPVSLKAEVVDVVNQFARAAILMFNVPGAAVDFLATTIVHMDRFKGIDNEELTNKYAKLLEHVPPAQYAFALSKLITHGKTILRVAKETGMLHHVDYQYGKKSVIGDIKFAGYLPFWLSGNMPKVVALADRLSLADLEILKNNKNAIKDNKEKLRQAIDDIEFTFGKSRVSTQRIYSSNDYYQAGMMLKSWMPDLIWSRLGEAQRVNGVTYQGKYRTFYHAIANRKKPEGMTDKEFAVSMRAAIYGGVINTAAIAVLAGWLKGLDWDDEDETTQGMSFLERIMSQVNPMSINSLIYTAKNIVPPIGYVVNTMEFIRAVINAATGSKEGVYRRRGKYGEKGEYKWRKELMDITPGAPLWRSVYNDKRKKKASFVGTGASSDSGGIDDYPDFDMDFNTDFDFE